MMNPADHHFGDAPDEESSTPDNVVSRALLLAAALLLLWGVFLLGQAAARRPARPLPTGPLTTGAGDAPAGVVVYVAGRVRRPGVYTLPPNARVYDALKKANGALPDADLSALNLAAWAQDGEKISVPARRPAAQRSLAPAQGKAAPRVQSSLPPEYSAPPSENTSSAAPSGYPASNFELPLAFAETPRPRGRKPKQKARSAKTDGIPRATTRRGERSKNAAPEYLQAHPININTATTEQLQLLPGIGPAIARRILDYRAAHGPFHATDDLTSIRGISEKKLEQLRPLITTGVPPASTPVPTPGATPGATP